MMETTVINKNYHYFIKIYNEQHIILSFYSILNTVNFNYNLYIWYAQALYDYLNTVSFRNIGVKLPDDGS